MSTVPSSPIKKRSSFTTARKVELDTTRNGHTLFAFYDLAFDIGFLGSGITIRVPDGFISDGPSWPAWVDRFLAFTRTLLIALRLERYTTTLPDSHMSLASALHDYLRERLLFPKFMGDWIFLTALKAEGCNFCFRWLAFFAVLCNFSRRRAIDKPFIITESP